MATQSRLLTGSLTGIGKWNLGGDAWFESSRSGKPLLGTPGTEAERLAKVRKRIGVVGIKTDNALQEMISLTGATPLKSSDMSLVDGNVTVGGGKATRKTT